MVPQIKEFKPSPASLRMFQSSHVCRIDSTNEKFPDNQDGKEAERFHNICKALTLSICYGANIGGICALTGTPPNLILPGQLDK